MRDQPEVTAAAVRVPVGVVCGTRDRLAPPSWGDQLAAITAGRAAVVPGAHNFCFTAAAELSASVRGGWTTAEQVLSCVDHYCAGFCLYGDLERDAAGVPAPR